MKVCIFDRDLNPVCYFFFTRASHSKTLRAVVRDLASSHLRRDLLPASSPTTLSSGLRVLTAFLIVLLGCRGDPRAVFIFPTRFRPWPAFKFRRAAPHLRRPQLSSPRVLAAKRLPTADPPPLRDFFAPAALQPPSPATSPLIPATAT